MTDTRERRIENLKDATGENTASKAIDSAADFYLKMHGDTTAVPNGQFVKLMEHAEGEGSLTPQQIARILDTIELPVKHESEWSVGESDPESEP